jgi:Protein of unknown function (DUF5818)
MKRLVVASAGSLALLFCGVGFAVAKDMSYTGEVMDGQCAQMGSHENMMKNGNLPSEKACALSCIKMGGKLVLFNAQTKTVYQLDDQTKSRDFAGDKVTVTGTLDNATKTIHVADIKAAS